MIKATKSQYLKVARELKKKILNTPGEYKAYLNKRVVSDKQVYYRYLFLTLPESFIS